MWCTRRIVVGLTGIAATLLLHSLILQLLFGTVTACYFTRDYLTP